ncbi:MAG: potassium-transporting ATPase subunit KdpA [Gammaproteobacteria bacterium]
MISGFILNAALQISLLLALVMAMMAPLGRYMARVYRNEPLLLDYILKPVERLFYRMTGIDPIQEMDWKQYALAVLCCGLIGFVILFLILRFQAYFPLNPQSFPNLTADLAFNTAASFTTNTNWQAYGGESTLSYFSQMIGLTVQNFISASMGMAVAVALTRGIARHHTRWIGHFWVDLVRGILYILLPLSLVVAIILGSQGVIQNFNHYEVATLIEQSHGAGQPIQTQLIPGGPVASQVAIKQLGSNGGGFFNTNSAHPFENPTPFSNFVELLAILMVPTAFCFTFGALVKDERQGWSLFIAMTLIFLPLTIFCVLQEQHGNTLLNTLNIDQEASAIQPGGNMEGKEVRFGIINSALWASATTATSNGSVNSMHDSFTALGGLVPLIFMHLGEIIYGGVGSGLYGVLIFVLITVFIAGLLVGRTPEYLGKKISAFEIKMASLCVLIPVIVILFGTSLALLLPDGKAAIFNPGVHGMSEVLYAFSSAGNNNGSAFAGLSANSPFYNVILGIAMLICRYWLIIPVLAIAGYLGEKEKIPVSAGTLSTHSILFIILLVSTILLVGLLTYIPVLSLGPITEYLTVMN